MDLLAPDERAETLAQFPVVIRFAVQWGDMDAFAHLNNTVYFRYFENARIAYFDAMSLGAGGKPKGAAPILARTSCRFRAPITYPDTVQVGARVGEIGADRFTMHYAVHSERFGRLAADGEGVIVAFDYDQQTKTTVPDAWRARIGELEGPVDA